MDYSISCLSPIRFYMLLYGWLMILLFPFGVTATYFALLYSARSKLRSPARDSDESLTSKAFLWEPYKPEFWYFEVVQTLLRLSLTGLLSTVEPGTFTQLSSGLLMSFLAAVLIAIAKPYEYDGDNAIAIMTSCQLVLVFLTATFLKNKETMREAEVFSDADDFDEASMGVVLLVTYAVVVVLFLFWAVKQREDEGASQEKMAAKALKNARSKVINSTTSLTSEGDGGSNIGGKSVCEKREVEMTGLRESGGSEFFVDNPMTDAKRATKEKKKDEKPPQPVKVGSEGLLKVDIGRV